MKTVYYAIGGGLGHVTRARRVLRALGIDALVIGSCADADRVVVEGDDIRAIIGSPDRLIIDTFPFGILHELVGIDGPRIDYVARRLRNYALECGDLQPLFHTT